MQQMKIQMKKVDLTDLHDLKKKCGADRLCIILDVNDKFLDLNEVDRKKLTEGSKTFVRQCVLPMLRCCKERCNFDTNVFLENHGEIFSHSKFKCKHYIDLMNYSSFSFRQCFRNEIMKS